MEAYIYTYVNKENKKTYIGSRSNYKGSYKDDFNIRYFSSSKDKQFRQDMSDGKLDGQVVLVINSKNAKKRVIEVEHQMIMSYWDKFGKENSYNHYANGKFNCVGLHWNNNSSWMKGKHHSEETKQKISNAKKGREPWNKGKKGVQTAWNKGKTWSEDVRKKISDKLSDGRLKGENNPRYGVEVSEETRAKISAANKGHKNSEEARKKMSQALKGRKFTEEHKKKIAESRLGTKKVKCDDGKFHYRKVSESESRY